MRIRLRKRARALALAGLVLGGASAASAVDSPFARTRQAPDGSADVSDPTTAEPQEPRVLEAAPLTYEPNLGQADSSVRFLAHAAGYTAFLTDDALVLAVSHRRRDSDRGRAAERATDVPDTAEVEPGGESVRMTIAGARAGVSPFAETPVAGVSNYFGGSDPSTSVVDVPHYESVRWPGVYDGVDARFHAAGRELEYDFEVAPGADASQIRLRFEGQRRLFVSESGDAVLKLARGELRQARPRVYQEGSAGKAGVEARYRAETDGEVSIALGAYDPSEPLVVDPRFYFTDGLGGTSEDYASDISVSASGSSMYVSGTTESTDFPTTPGAFEPSGSSVPGDGFVTRLDVAPSGGISLGYSTYLRGVAFDLAFNDSVSNAVDASGSVYLAGTALNQTFPTTVGAYQRQYGGYGDAFVTKLGPSGDTLLYSTFVGGGDTEHANHVVIDAGGSAYVIGQTWSSSFPTTPGVFQPVYAGSGDAFATKLAPDGGSLVYSTFLGGGNEELAFGLAVDPSGAAVIVGQNHYGGFPTTQFAYQATSARPSSGFVTKLAAGGSLIYSTYLGGGSSATVRSVALDATGAAYVTGWCWGSSFPTTPGAYDRTGTAYDGFVTKLSPDGRSLAYSTYLGGSGTTWFNDVAVSTLGEACVVGFSNSRNYPRTGFGNLTIPPGYNIAATKLAADGRSVVSSCVLGGRGYDGGIAVTLDGGGTAYVVSQTDSNDFPTTFIGHRGATDLVVTKLDLFEPHVIHL